jgi:hypothetical protein
MEGFPLEQKKGFPKTIYYRRYIDPAGFHRIKDYAFKYRRQERV